jgi:hypothetical protein
VEGASDQGIVGTLGESDGSQLLESVIVRVVAGRYRGLVPLMIAVTLLEQVLRLAIGRRTPVASIRTAPGADATWAMLPVAAALLIWPLAALRSVLRRRAVSDAGLGDEVARGGEVRFPSTAQPPHDRPQLFALARVPRAPGLDQQLPRGDERDGVAHQAAMTPRSFGGSVDRRSVARGGACPAIDPQGAGGGGSGVGIGARPAHARADVGEERVDGCAAVDPSSTARERAWVNDRRGVRGGAPRVCLGVGAQGCARSRRMLSGPSRPARPLRTSALGAGYRCAGRS